MRVFALFQSNAFHPKEALQLPTIRLNVMDSMATAKIVIAGGGFAGLYAAKYFDKRLARRDDVEVTLAINSNECESH